MSQQPMLEPQALELRPDDDGRIQLSIAISLKRIADNLPGLDFSMIDNWVQTIAWNAGRSFEAGRRQ